ncbi:hypothetical protein HanXRQr2_Chr11g0483591 [Helianthus annuus]|uniref:Uncharacterized protein n=1 Tax=Helianthus annuus TaxID=4232 RepID=A0A9K3MZF1_HELAN|nr:hypothetical protein HanXRQr2_Chr11g0483591 [Helianthus annuus]
MIGKQKAEKAYNDLRLESCPSSGGISPDKALMPTVLKPLHPT